MIAARIPGHTRYLGAPVGWEPDEQGDCAHLAIRDETIDGQPLMMSLWEPTPVEIARIIAGAKVRLTIAGRGHPPVMLSVPPLDEGEPSHA